MNNKTKIIIAGLILIGISFYGGIKYNQSKTPARGTGSALGQGFNRGQRSAGQNSTNGFISGEVLSIDSTSVTLKMRDNGSKIVFVSPSTSVMKTVSGSLNDIKIGTQVTTVGTANTDGSITAESIQIRQATTTKE